MKAILRRNVVIACAAISVLACTLIQADGNTRGNDYRDGFLYMPTKGFVPDDSTAIKIAEAVWLPIYGKGIYDSQPFVARLVDDTVWIVEGTMPEKYLLGGVPYAEIHRWTCRVIRVNHGK